MFSLSACLYNIIFDSLCQYLFAKFLYFFCPVHLEGASFLRKKRITAGHNHCYIIILDTWAGRTPHDRRGGALWCNSEVRIWRDPKK